MLIIRSVVHEAELIPHHQEAPVYVPVLKTLVTIGHFVTISHVNALGSTERVVGQIIR